MRSCRFFLCTKHPSKHLESLTFGSLCYCCIHVRITISARLNSKWWFDRNPRMAKKGRKSSQIQIQLLSKFNHCLIIECPRFEGNKQKKKKMPNKGLNVQLIDLLNPISILLFNFIVNKERKVSFFPFCCLSSFETMGELMLTTTFPICYLK